MMFGLTNRKKNLVQKQTLSPVFDRGGWFPLIMESFTGAWQTNTVLSKECILAFSAVYACITLIASDIAKLPIKIMEQDSNGIWNQIKNTLAPSIIKPNGYQNRIKFFEQWLISKLTRGNAYIFKERDSTGKII